ncbi:MAG: trypsin-like peptidase domain-containing protein [Candidatus Peribacteraceae bacterium]|jgi:hypothetical protein|nr:trypsin-like peptidase domain-containing protein [Candidatus Peribacteraceae bacterium]MDP7646043.1 trypsin-like peptidase domain-containing protein [Candidatus Peribacteraceae bacterium]|tara:strand:+ start:288 stop:2120 length:1833 start_codon:yes stop_codon:yes gene_type:complete
MRILKTFIWLSLIALPGVAIPANASFTPMEVIRATVRLEATDPLTGISAGRGSGVFVSKDGWILTNRHVVESFRKQFNQIRVIPTGDNEEMNEKCSFTVEPGDIVASPSDDIALIVPRWPKGTLPCGGPPSFLPPVSFIGFTGMDIQIIGYPGTDQGSGSVAVTEGQVAGRMMIEGENRIRFLKVSANIGPGSSGGPVVDSKGRLVAIAAAMTQIKHTSGLIQELVGLVIPTGNIVEVFGELPTSNYVEDTSPSDVSDTAWYSKSVSAFHDAGYEITANGVFRPSDKATRAEFIALIVDLLGGPRYENYEDTSFSDVSRRKDYFKHFEEAVILGLVKGAGNCVGSLPCNAYPDAPINRAEAAILLLRAFDLKRTSNAPSFRDSPRGEWYTDGIEAAASLCILRGDDGAKTVRPADNMNRAEMLVMLTRLHQNLVYPNCTSGSARAFSIPDAPKPESSEDGSSSLVGLTPCTQSAWDCLVVSTCGKKLTQMQKCTLKNDQCSDPERAKPPQEISCIPAEKKLREMIETTSQSEAMLRTMGDKALELSPGIAQRALEVRQRYSAKLEQYKGYISGATKYSNYIKIKMDEIKLTEKSLTSIENEFFSINGVER